MINLDGNENTETVTSILKLSADKNITMAFVSLSTLYKQAGAQDTDYKLGEKIFSRFGGSFAFDVIANFRDANDKPLVPTEDEVLLREKSEESQRSKAMTYIYLVLAGLVLVAFYILLMQYLCGDHSQKEFQKRAMIYKK